VRGLHQALQQHQHKHHRCSYHLEVHAQPFIWQGVRSYSVG
jgi:hypothetical protein